MVTMEIYVCYACVGTSESSHCNYKHLMIKSLKVLCLVMKDNIHM
jgi:hypothetical protein